MYLLSPLSHSWGERPSIKLLFKDREHLDKGRRNLIERRPSIKLLFTDGEHLNKRRRSLIERRPSIKL
jgi:hypothetical protein